MSDSFTLEIKGLNQLIKSMKGKLPTCRIGILGDESRTGKGSKVPTNAEIGAVHEFGAPSKGIPQRSFLRMPLTEHLEKEMESSGLLDKETLAEVVKQGSIKPWLEKIAVVSEGVVLDAFETKGGGKWPPWKNPSYTNEGGTLLVDSQQLRNSVTSKVGD